MRTRPLAAALLIACAPATFAGPVWAQPAADDATTSVARARFKEGVEFYDKGDYEQARAAFLQAYALKKHPAVLLNLAWSCLKSGHALEAERYFKQFLTEGKDITDKQKADANDGLTQSHSKLGRIEITAASGTEVTIDGEKVGTAPLTDPVAVEAGAHTVKFKGPDGATDTQSVTVLGGQKASARFGGATTATPPAATTTAATPTGDTTASTPSTPPADDTSKPADQTPPKETPDADTGRRGGPLSPPNNLVPVVVLGLGAAAGFVLGGAMYFVKQSAQDKANQVATEITANGGGRGTCTNPTPKFASACNAYVSDNNDVNSDATVGNIALGVGVAATVGVVVYWLVADKSSPGGAATAKPILAPVVGPSIGGLSLAGSF